MTVAAVVAAAGRGERLGPASGAPKALLEIGGRSLLDLALERLLAAGADQVVVVHPAGQRRTFAGIAAPHGPVDLVEGGATRSDSVRNGVRAVASGHHLVAIHDAARPLTPPAVIRAAVEAVAGEVIAAAPGLAVPDTLKRAGRDGHVVATVDRAGLWAVHTPQVIRADVLRATLEWAGTRHATDDLGLVEAARAAGIVSGAIRIVRGDLRGLKITFPEDIDVAAALLAYSTGVRDGARR